MSTVLAAFMKLKGAKFKCLLYWSFLADTAMAALNRFRLLEDLDCSMSLPVTPSHMFSGQSRIIAGSSTG